MQKKRFQLKQALRVSVVRRQFLLQMKAKYAGELYIFIFYFFVVDGIVLLNKGNNACR